jgi:hypothetical protein
MNEEIKDYIKKNLGIDWKYINGKLYIVLLLDGEIISKIRFTQE